MQHAATLFCFPQLCSTNLSLKGDFRAPLIKAFGLLYKLLIVANQNECQGYFLLK